MMKCIGFSVLLSILFGLPACGLAIDWMMPANDSLPPAPDPAQETEYQGDHDMKREFCTVVTVSEAFFVLKNTEDEFYHVDLSFLGDFKEGDEVLLIYSKRSPVEDGVFRADVQSVFPDSSILQYPAN